MADNQIQVTRLNTPRNIYEASGNPLDIIGESEFYVKLPVLGKVKRLTCLVLRGEEVDREILISCAMLKKWDMIHQTFPAQTLSDYIRNLDRKICNTYDSNKCFEIYEKSNITTKEKLSKT